jgi:hypothetical protein
MYRAQNNLQRQIQCAVSAADSASGNFVLIPRLEVLSWHSELRDWRRVAVIWNGERYVVSRSVWDNASPVAAGKAAGA